MSNIPRKEYPRPQFVRENWMNLNGTWAFEIDNGRSGEARGLQKVGTALSGEITVPFCPESELSGVQHTDFMYGVWYKRTVTVTEKQLKGRAVLHFGAVDYCAKVFVNGKLAGTHKGGYVSFEFDVTALLKAGENEIAVYAEDNTRDRLIPSGKQSEQYNSYGCFYTRTTGIWQTVWLEFTPKAYISRVQYYVAFAFGEDNVTSYFGLREVRLDGHKFRINGRSVFQRLVLDQGFYPDGIYTAPSDEALENDIKLSLAVGFNGARLHEKIFEERFLYHADRLGYIVWGEFPNWGLDSSYADSVYGILPEWTEEIRRDFNRPAIVGWCPYNETWDTDGRKQFDDALDIVYRATKALDPTRPCIDTSGNYHVATDIFCVHDYEQNPEIFKEHYDKLMTEGTLFDNHAHRQTYKGEATFVSEYGGIQWSQDESGWGYGTGPKTEEEFLTRFKGLTDALLDNSEMFGLCYTQLTDVEQEQNGLYTYQRKPKFDPAFFHGVLSRKAAIED